MKFTYCRSNWQPSKRGTRLVGEYGVGNYWGVYTNLRMEDGTKVKITAGKKYVTPRDMNWCQVRIEDAYDATIIMSPSIVPEWAREEVDYLVDCIRNQWYWSHWDGEDTENRDYRYPNKKDITPEWANGYRLEHWYKSEGDKDGELAFYNSDDELVLLAWVPKHDSLEDLYRKLGEYHYIIFEWAGFYWEGAKHYVHKKPSSAYSMAELEQIAGENNIEWVKVEHLGIRRMNIVKALKEADLLN